MKHAGVFGYDLASVVERRSAATHFVRKHVLRHTYPESMVSRQSRPARWFSTRVLRQKPHLYHFEFHVTDHCNLNCRGCGHFSNLSRPTFADIHEFETDMQSMAHLFSVEQIMLLGGEPLLHPEIAEFVKTARRVFPGTRLYVMTNGVLVTRMGEDFWQALSETGTILLCDLYPIGLPVEEINSLGLEHGVKIEWTPLRTEFFKIPIDVDAKQKPKESFQRCNGINNCPMVRNGRLYPCAYSAYSDVFAEKFDLPGLEASSADSISLRESLDPNQAMDFLLKPVPWCSHCDFDSFEMFPWTRSERRLEEWVSD